MKSFISKILYILIKYYDYKSYRDIKFFSASMLLLFFISLNILTLSILFLWDNVNLSFKLSSEKKLNDMLNFLIFSIPYFILINIYFKESEILAMDVTDKQLRKWQRIMVIYIVFTFLALIMSGIYYHKYIKA